MKIVIAEKISPVALAVFAEQADWTVVSRQRHSDGELAEADALLVRSAVFVDAAMMDKAPKLRVIGRAGVGVDNIDLEAATKRGIVVMNTPGGNAVAVAEHTLALMLALARDISPAPIPPRMPASGRRNRCRAPSCAARRWASLAWARSASKSPKRAQSLRHEGGCARSIMSPPAWRSSCRSRWFRWRKYSRSRITSRCTLA